MAGGGDHRLAWLAWLETERRYGANTLAAYAGDLDDYRIFTGGGDTAAPDRRAFRGWLADMTDRGLARSTIARRVSALRSFYRFCGRTGRLDISDLGWLRAPRPPKSVPKPVSEEEARALLAAIFRRRGDDWAKQRDFALLMLLYGSGLRISEALSLVRGDAPLGDWLRITGKGGKIREVPVLPAVAEAVTAYLAACPFDGGPDAPLFVGSRGNGYGARAAQSWSRRCALSSACRRMSRRMRFATPLPRIFWDMVPIFAPSRNFSAMPACRQRSAIPALTRRIFCGCIARRIPAPGKAPGPSPPPATCEWRGRRRQGRLPSPPRSASDDRGRCGRYPRTRRQRPWPWRIHE